MASQGLFHSCAPPVISSNASATRRSKETQLSRSLANAAIFHAASNAARKANGTVEVGSGSIDLYVDVSTPNGASVAPMCDGGFIPPSPVI